MNREDMMDSCGEGQGMSEVENIDKIERLKILRDDINGNFKAKTRFLKDGIHKNILLFNNRELFTLSFEILAIVSKITSTNTEYVKKYHILFNNMKNCCYKEQKTEMDYNEISQTSKEVMMNDIMPLFLEFEKYTDVNDIYTLSLFRSLKILIKNLKIEIIDGKIIAYMMRKIELYSENYFLNEIKNEILETVSFLIDNYQVDDCFKNKKFIDAINHPSVNSLNILAKLINEDTQKYFKINKIIKRADNYGLNDRKTLISTRIKLYGFMEDKNFTIRNKILDMFKEQIKYDNSSYVLLGKMIQNDLKAEIYCKDIGIINIIDKRFDESTLSIEKLFCLYSLISKYEENRKLVAKTQIISYLFCRLGVKTDNAEFDEEFVGILYFFKAMTRSILFLRSDLLEYPIVNLLFTILSKLDQLDDVDTDILTEKDYVDCDLEQCSLEEAVRCNYGSRFDTNNKKILKLEDGKTSSNLSLVKNLKNNNDPNHVLHPDTLKPNKDDHSVKKYQEQDDVSQSIAQNNNLSSIYSEISKKCFVKKDKIEEEVKVKDYSEIFKCKLNKNFMVECVLNIFCNLVFEFGCYKECFIDLQGIQVLSKYRHTHPKTILTMLKNFLYNTDWKIKDVFIKNTDKQFFLFFYQLFEKSNDLELLKLIFNLKRNLVCDDSLDLIIFNYDGFIEQIFKYLMLFASDYVVVYESIEEKVLIQIFYTIVNLSANSERFRNMFMKKEYIDSIIKLGTTRDLLLSSLWIIINLTWKEKGFEDRVEMLKRIGIDEWLLSINSNDPIIIDKIETALENLK